jgi:hypothetical protein
MEIQAMTEIQAGFEHKSKQEPGSDGENSNTTRTTGGGVNSSDATKIPFNQCGQDNLIQAIQQVDIKEF